MGTHIPAQGSVAVEARARLWKHHAENGLDPVTGQPYFAVFNGNPVEMVHDWPDFGDLAARYWGAAHMVGDMVGEQPSTTGKLGALLLSCFQDDGLNYRPLTLYTVENAELFDQSRTLACLCSVYMATGADDVRAAMTGLVDGLARVSETDADGYRYMPGSRYSHGEWVARRDDCGYFVGPLIRPLVKTWDLLGYEPALDLASDLARYVVDKSGVIGPDGELRGHIHSRLATASGLFTCGKADGNRQWVDMAKRAWAYIRRRSGPWGFIPEYLDADHSALFRSETCAIMDFMDLTLLLANDGEESMWAEAEQVLRNHLIESQVTRADWGSGAPARPRDELTLSDNVPDRMLGAFAGWSAFDRFFGQTPRFGEDWLKRDVTPRDVYLGKPRLFQNCCSGAGLKAIYLAWSQAVQCRGDELRVNLLINRATPQARVTVRGDAGSVEVTVKPTRACSLSVRKPDWAEDEGTAVTKNGEPVSLELSGSCLLLPRVEAGACVTVRLPLATATGEFEGVDGRSEPERFAVVCKGDSVLRVRSLGGGPSGEEKAQASVMADAYPLYQRNATALYSEEPAPRVVAPAIDWF